MAQKRYGQALEHYRKASAKGRNSALVLAQYRAAVLAGVPQAAKDLETWVAANPKDVEAVSMLAEERQRRGDVDGAIKLYERSLAELPDNPVLLNNLAVLYQDKGNPAAVDMAAKAYAAAPKAAAIQDTYGWLLVQTGKVDKGLELLREAAKGMPNNAEVQYHYAAALAKTGNTAEAIPILKKALNGQLPPGAKADAQKLLQQLSKQKG
jgi:tetratricopeptide (TPR) repeat protein